ncbi:ribonuclease P protein component [Coxiella endosymbiont of Amblyomma nuttalli]|uniref:ribonuclease P protein component n=1 Tax=Coxiella endosymbiont of Amblyomma nuttalli TaxID=2749996 RepID=UPI001FD62FF6|nr:ribonuclease P protein component [Coxiella endosymbiont of Amblyomma nuttalli]
MRTTTEFQHVYSKHQRLSGRYYSLYYLDNNIGHTRLGVIVSKRNVRKAVIRNRIRRIVKEAFRRKKNQLVSLDLVFIAKVVASQASNRELYKCINRLLEQLVK